jgi:ribose-phosphate pyrophosphokinase
VLVGEKRRNGDRDVAVTIAGIERTAGRKVVLVDDVISSGMTLVSAAEQLVQAGAAGIEALATHCLASPPDIARMHAAGIARIRATDTVPGPLATLPLANLLADALRAQAWNVSWPQQP